MGWFDEQIRSRKDKDQEIFEDSILEMASAVLGLQGAGVLHDERIITKAVIDEVLKYYHFKPVDIPDSVKTPEDQLEYALRPHGILYRRVTLAENWYRNAFGPMIAFRTEDGLPVVLLPKRFSGYSWTAAAGNKITAGKKTAELLQSEAICFYSPLPMKRLGIPDLLGYMKNCLNWSDYAFVLGLTLLVTLAGMLLPHITRLLSGFVLESGSSLILWSTALFLLCVLISSQLLSASRELAISRLQGKVSLPMEAAMMMRLMSLPTPFFRQYSAGELASRSGGINRLTALLLGGVFSTGVSALASLLYLNQIFSYAPALGVPALLINLVMLAFTLLIGFMRTKENRAYMQGAAEESGVSYAIISGIQKVKLSGAEKRAFARWARIYAAGAEIEYNPPLLLKIGSAVTLAVSLAGTVILYYFAASSGVSPSAYLAATAAFGSVTGAFGAFAGIASGAAQIGPILEMAEPILKTEPETAEGKEIITRLSGSIELSGVSFRYSDRSPYIIDNLNLSERIKTAIDNQDVRQFHRMINEITAEHLGAIQVLGFLLGILAGLLQLLPGLWGV